MSDKKLPETTWAGMNDKIHAPKLTWSVGKPGFPEPPNELIIDKRQEQQTDDLKDASYKWLLAKKLSNLF
jgi:hypothetical protein